MKRYPLSLLPVSREILWGGRRLKDAYGKSAPFEKLAESWELTVRPDGQSRIRNGFFAGMTLGDYLAKDPTLVSPRYAGERFPLLIKLIDAADRLSVQVHPDDRYALPHEGELGKTEMWYIVEAQPGARLVYGLKDGVTREAFAEAVRAGRTMETLREVEVHAGETYFIPSGQIHAIGAGILIAEIQQSSNVTYRVYDYDRRQADGSLRQLHTEKALDVTRIRTEAEIDALRFAHGAHAPTTLADCAYFRVDKPALPAALDAADGFLALLCVGGEGAIECEGERYPIRRGESYFIPCGTAPCTLTGSAEILVSRSYE